MGSRASAIPAKHDARCAGCGRAHMYGNTVKCDEWEGQTFKYWTVGKNDPLYNNVGHDIVFQDGPTGVTWRWGNFNVTIQPADVFELPTVGDCSESCPTFLTDSEIGALHRDPHVRRSIEGHHRRAALQMTWLCELWV